MNIIDFFRIAQKRLHDELRKSVRDLTMDEWHYRTGGTDNSIAFIFWHCVRTEDNILRFILQKRPTIWADGNWHERLSPAEGAGYGYANTGSSLLEYRRSRALYGVC